MRRQDKADRIAAMLGELYPTPAPPLDHSDPFTLLVAVLLSAQCTDERVNQVTPALFAAARTPEAMAALDATQIESLIRTCGLAPNKSKNIRELSRKLVADHGSVVPRTLEELEELAGVGHKTASVVMAQAFGVPAFPVDTHIQRLAGRWGLSKANNVAVVERDLKKLFAPEIWNDIHLQIIFFGREHCPARGHDFAVCPICRWAASKKRIVQEAKKAALAAEARKAKAAEAKKAKAAGAKKAKAAGAKRAKAVGAKKKAKLGG